MHNLQEINYRRAIIGTIWSRPAALGLLASTVLLGHSVCGQDAATVAAPPPATTTNQPPSTLNPQPQSQPSTINPQLSTPFTSFRLGPFDIQPRISTGVTYDDNILISSHNPESDLIWSLKPAFLAVTGDRLAIEDYRLTYHDVVRFSPDTFIITDQETWPGRTLMVDYGPQFNWFTKYRENDSIDEFLHANALWPMGKLILGLRQDYVLQNTTIIEAGRRSWEQTMPTVLMAGYQFSDKTTAEVNLSHNSVSYEQQGMADYSDWNWDNWFNYQYSPRLNLSLGANLGILDLSSQPQQTYETPMVRARYRYGERVILDGSIGVQLRQYDGGVPNTAEPVCNLVAYYQASENSAFDLTLFRRESPSVSPGYDYMSTGASLGVHQRLGDRYSACLRIAYYDFNYLATSQALVASGQASTLNNYIEVRPELEIRFTRHLVGSLFYLFRTMQASRGDGWTDNQVGTRLTWTF
jgi:hypothetical protein